MGLMRQRGIPTYTRHSIAFPDVAMHSGSPSSVYDEISVVFEAKGGGQHGGGIRLSFHRFAKDPSSHLQLHVFSDGFKALADERVQDMLTAMRRTPDGDWTPERVEGYLRAAGFRPSVYHLRLERPTAPYERQKQIDKEIAALRRHEEEWTR